MATVSKYDDPREYVMWYLENGKIALVTTFTDDIEEVVQSIDESVTDGMLIRHKSEPVALDPAAANISAETLPINARLHEAILDYVMHRVLTEKGKQEEGENRRAKEFYQMFLHKIYRLPNKVMAGGDHLVIPSKRYSVRRSF